MVLTPLLAVVDLEDAEDDDREDEDDHDTVGEECDAADGQAH